MSQSKSDCQTDELVEQLAGLMHKAWMHWSKSVALKEELSAGRIKRWKRLWIPYEQLAANVKEQDRIWARKAVDIFRRCSH